MTNEEELALSMRLGTLSQMHSKYFEDLVGAFTDHDVSASSVPPAADAASVDHDGGGSSTASEPGNSAASATTPMFTKEDIDAVTLRDSDAFDAAIMELVALNRKKRADYTSTTDIFQNFKEVSESTGVSVAVVFDVLIATKNARLKALRSNDREPSNEAVIDSILDRAVYAVLAYAYAKANS